MSDSSQEYRAMCEASKGLQDCWTPEFGMSLFSVGGTADCYWEIGRRKAADIWLPTSDQWWRLMGKQNIVVHRGDTGVFDCACGDKAISMGVAETAERAMMFAWMGGHGYTWRMAWVRCDAAGERIE